MIDLSLISKNQTIAVALSGGKDSMCLLDCLLKISKQQKITVKAINIDHSIRGKESENDSLFVKNYCESLGVPLKFFKVDAINFSKENKYTLEEGARILRYNIFNKLLNEGFCDKIATAHHLNDNFESVLFNLFRGSGLKGLAGISPCNNNFIRPLLNASKKEIEDYVLKNNIPFVEDKSNLCNDYTRNYIRNEITPLILEKFPNALSSVKRLSDISREENEYLEEVSKRAIFENDEGYYIDVNTPLSIYKRAVILILNKLGLKKDYEKIHIEEVFYLKSLQNGAKITLPKNIVAINNYGKILFKIDSKQEKFEEVPFEIKDFKYLDKTYKFTMTKVDNSLLFDLDKLPKTCVIRNRQDGDVFTKFGGGTKKLKDYLIDKKIPKHLRDNLLVIANNNDVLLILGVEISDKIKIDNQTKNVIYSYID